MDVNKVRELENEVREVNVGNHIDSGKSWEEKNIEREGDLVEDEGDNEFFIGDTMLARGEVVENWGGESLEDAVDWDEAQKFGVFDRFEDGGFSYDAASDSGEHVYGVNPGVGGVYSAGGDSGKVYAAGNVYNEGSSGEKSMYGVVEVSVPTTVYSMEMPKSKSKDKQKRRGNGSGLESISKKRKSGWHRDVSIL